MKRLRAIKWALSVCMKTRSPATDTLRLLPGDRAFPTRPCVGGLGVLPQTGAGAGIEGDHRVGVGHVHDAVVDLRRALQARRIRHRDDPFQRQAGDVGLADLRHRRYGDCR